MERAREMVELELAVRREFNTGYLESSNKLNNIGQNLQYQDVKLSLHLQMVAFFSYFNAMRYT